MKTFGMQLSTLASWSGGVVVGGSDGRVLSMEWHAFCDHGAESPADDADEYDWPDEDGKYWYEKEEHRKQDFFGPEEDSETTSEEEEVSGKNLPVATTTGANLCTLPLMCVCLLGDTNNSHHLSHPPNSARL